MRLFGRDLARETAIVAEIGVNHEGEPEAALRLVRLAAGAGADAVKFQSYTPARYAAANDAERLARVSRFALDEAAHRRIAAEAAACGIAFFSTPVTEDWVPFLTRYGAAIKIASGDLDFEPVIRTAARSGRPVILSTGLGTEAEIDRAVGWLRAELGGALLAERVVLLHCVTAYPTPIEEANLLAIPYLAERHGLAVGYSNHVIGLDACLGAVALGACVIEVHVTDRREGRAFRDHQLSLLPDELADLVRRVPGLCAARGQYGKPRQPSEAPLLPLVRKGVVAARDLEAGTRLAAEDLMYARPATEFAAGERDALIGRTLGVALKRGMLVPRGAVV
jgi:N-acetylneuraminate synthase/N,N'-diacetyllegionaminate synthase